MKIIDGIKLEGRPAEIPNCGRDDLPDFFVEMGYKVGAEIGVYKGEFTEKLGKAGLEIYGIDPWIVYKNYQKHPVELPYEKLAEGSKQRVAGYNVNIIRKTSAKALEDFEDESLDFVYIDANHSFPYISHDIYEWNRKVRKGGIISGHDYMLLGRDPYGLRVCHVRFAVDIYARIFGLKNYYVLGERNSTNRDKWRSWMWIKP